MFLVVSLCLFCLVFLGSLYVCRALDNIYIVLVLFDL